MSQVLEYLSYMDDHGARPLRPTQYEALSYVLHLHDNKTPGTVMNYISGVRTWLRLMGAPTTAFDTYLLEVLKKGIARSSSHVPTQAPPLRPTDVRKAVCFFNSAGDNGPVLSAALLLGYFTLLRQSNLLLSPVRTDPGHVLRAKDITLTREGLNVHVRSSKTLSKSSPPRDIAVPAIPGSKYCPVRAWRKYVSRTQPYLEGPAFITTDGLPLRPRGLLDTLRLALAVGGHPAPGAITLHSLRRGGAQACASSGSSLEDIKALGHWTSDAVHKYIPRHLIYSAPRTLAENFG